MQNFMKTIVNAVQSWTKKEIENRVRNSAADWNENATNKDSYVKNRTHWAEDNRGTIYLEEGNVSDFLYDDDGIFVYQTSFSLEMPLEVHKKYTVCWNGVEYTDVECLEDEGYYYLGIDPYGRPSTLYPFGLCVRNSDSIDLVVTSSLNSVHTVSIYDGSIKYHTLDAKYLPSNLATIDDIQSAQTTADNAQTTADNAQTTADNAQTMLGTKMDVTNPVGTGSFSMNRLQGSAVGDYSVAVGNGVVAAGRSRFVSGEYNIGSSVYHSEYSSFISGNILFHKSKSFYCSTEYTFDAESGIYTLISPTLVTALDIRTFITNKDTDILFVCEGTLKLVPNSVSGNMLVGIDETSTNEVHNDYYYKMSKYRCHRSRGSSVDLGTYAHIVGNGTSDTERSNAHTLDWSGNAWYQGDVYVGSTSGTNRDEGSKKLATEEYVDTNTISAPSVATVGQTIVVKSVDENGQPTEWEAVDPMVITSSTEGSNKKFKITVDDTGTLTVTEMIEQ